MTGTPCDFLFFETVPLNPQKLQGKYILSQLLLNPRIQNKELADAIARVNPEDRLSEKSRGETVLDHVIERIEKGFLNDKALACQRNAKIQTEDLLYKAAIVHSRSKVAFEFATLGTRRRPRMLQSSTADIAEGHAIAQQRRGSLGKKNKIGWFQPAWGSSCEHDQTACCAKKTWERKRMQIFW